MSTEINGDLLDGSWPHIVQQCNCLTVKPHGLSKQIADKYPYADIYSKRKQYLNQNLATEDTQGVPGTIVVSSPTTANPTIFHFLSQYEMGPPGKYKRTTTNIIDNCKNRQIWFGTCLAELENRLLEKYSVKKIAFPDHIGCGLAKGNWEIYKKMLDDFATRIKKREINTYIVKLTN
ncbi:MAG: hypothetical protein Satyrvirus7_18 [Satyrvirus sp.]|uniref:Macro domain-containing protein n=1 Tax=Satyrvirus sp. TaxID=2487771 RepID=A0A3G5AF59_9VIRU|nr:MAG: hypothetical protein Satyrvirus7_18 [Satyrvirus sp.]